MIEILDTLATSIHSMTIPELITLMTTFVTLLVAMERLFNSFSRAIRALIAFMRLMLYGDDEL
jgi:hypothetical protein